MHPIIQNRFSRLVLCIALSLTACRGGDAEQVQSDLDDLVSREVSDNGFVGAGIGVRIAEGRMFGSAAGSSDPDGAAPYDEAGTEQVIGSVTKLYTAVLVMQLVEQGRIGLDDTIDAWLTFPGAERITVRMLLRHTSGLNDYLRLMPLEQLGQPWTPQQLLDLAVAAGPIGEPGMEKGVYTNTNYLALAMIVEAETGVSWEENIQEHIVEPLDLHHTYYAGDRDRAANVAGGWVQTDAGWIDSLTLLDPSVGWGIGAMVATTSDLLRFTTALFDGELFRSRATLAAMRTYDTELDPGYPGEDPPTWIGLGITKMILDGITFEGHFGHIEGYNAGAQLDAETGEIIVVTSNDNNAWAQPIVVDVAHYLEDR